MWKDKVKLSVFGKASNKIIAVISFNEVVDGDKNLMNFLINNKITVASSCNGEGKCKKCIINNDVVSCQITVINFIRNFGNTIVINYL